MGGKLGRKCRRRINKLRRKVNSGIREEGEDGQGVEEEVGKGRKGETPREKVERRKVNREKGIMEIW